MKKETLLLGAHMSISGGMYKAFERGESIDCTAIQVFTKSNRQWFAKKLLKADIEAFQDAAKRSPIKKVNAHASYLINIGSPKPDVEKKSVKSLTEELQRCEQLAIPYLVFHPGASLNTNETACLDRIAHNIDKVLDRVEGATKLLIENMAGQGSTVCSSFEQIGYIFKQLKNKRRVGVCFDTCHAFAAGYDFSTAKGYEKMWQEFDNNIGLSKLHVIHVNDSKKECGSRVDRHAFVGKGKIGLNGFKLLMNDERLFNVAKILETPIEQSIQEYVPDMNTLKKLLTQENRKRLGL